MVALTVRKLKLGICSEIQVIFFSRKRQKKKASFQDHPHLFLKYLVSSDLKMNIPFANEYSMAWESFGWALSLPEDLKAFPFLIEL